MIKEIERLNREIDRLMTEKTKADAQKEVWESRLVESIKGYAKDYGVDLSGKDLVDIKKKLVAETNTIEAKTKEEFEKASKIVNLINEGDIKGAWKVLGVDIDAIENKESEEVVVEEKNSVEVQSAVEAVEEMDDDSFYGESFEEEEEYIESNDPVDFNTSVKNAEASKFNAFFMEDDEEEEEFVIPNTKNVSSVEHKQSDIKPSKSSTSSSFVMEDDEEDEFAGFGNILAGSKFKV